MIKGCGEGADSTRVVVRSAAARRSRCARDIHRSPRAQSAIYYSRKDNRPASANTGGNPICFLMNETGWCDADYKHDGFYLGQGVPDAMITRPSELIYIGEATGHQEWTNFHIAY